MCSASKVRCSKDKPICSRCNELGYPCFYSPARRMGRPHPPRSASAQPKPGAAMSLIRPRDESVARESFTEALAREQGTHAVLDFRAAASSEPGQTDCPQTDPYMPKDPPYQIRADHVEDTALFNFNEQVNRANLIEVDRLYCHTLPSDDASMMLPNLSAHSSSTSSTIDQALAYGVGLASESDCATIAMNMLQHLSITSATFVSEIEGPHLDALISTVSMAVKRISTILVCPCSQKTDVGLLAAAVCAAILDTYGIVFRNSARSRSHLSSVTRDADRMEICTESIHDGPNEKATIMRLLPKVASVVMQFTKRYSQDTEEFSADFLPVLAASLKSRLKSMTNEATDWLTQD